MPCLRIQVFGPHILLIIQTLKQEAEPSLMWARHFRIHYQIHVVCKKAHSLKSFKKLMKTPSCFAVRDFHFFPVFYLYVTQYCNLWKKCSINTSLILFLETPGPIPVIDCSAMTRQLSLTFGTIFLTTCPLVFLIICLPRP